MQYNELTTGGPVDWHAGHQGDPKEVKGDKGPGGGASWKNIDEKWYCPARTEEDWKSLGRVYSKPRVDAINGQA